MVNRGKKEVPFNPPYASSGTQRTQLLSNVDTFTDSQADGESERTVRFDPEAQEVYDSDEEGISSEEEEYNKILRVYDARFKIPAQSNLGQLMAAKGS